MKVKRGKVGALVGAFLLLIGVIFAAQQYTSSEFSSLREHIRGDIASLREDIREDVASLRGDIGSLRKDVREDIGSLRKDVREDIASLRSDVASVTRRVRAWDERSGWLLQPSSKTAAGAAALMKSFLAKELKGDPIQIQFIPFKVPPTKKILIPKKTDP